MAVTARRQRGLRTPYGSRAIAAVGCAVLLLSACSDGGDQGKDKKQSKPTKSASPKQSESSDPQAAEKKKVLDAYGHMWAEQAKAYAKGSEKGTELEKYASKDALGRALGDLMAMKQGGTVTKGEPTHDAKVTSLEMDVEIPKARISDCLDISQWKTVDRKTGAVKPFPEEQPKRYITAVEAEFWKEQQQWMITKITPKGERTC